MPVLSDRHLSDLYPQFRGAIGPASIDLHVGETLTVWPRWILRDPRVDQSGLWKSVPLEPLLDSEGEPVDEPCWTLQPGLRYLATTREHLRIPDDMAGQLSARSSWGRDGLAVICGPAGWLDPGFSGVVVLELSVIGSELVIWPGASVCQLILHQLTSACDRPYQGRYQNQSDVTPSRLHLDRGDRDGR